eukprot:4165377-Amphidinium_carterae.1
MQQQPYCAGEHLSRDEVNALTEPRAEHISAVDTFLREHGVTAQTEYVTLRHRRTGANITRALGGYSVPQVGHWLHRLMMHEHTQMRVVEAVSNAVDFIAPT